MSNLHTTAGVYDPQASALFITAAEAAATTLAIIRALAMRVVDAVQGQWTQRQLARLSDHILCDLGFERDWDGSIRSLRDAD